MPSIMIQEIHFPENPYLKILQPLVTGLHAPAFRKWLLLIFCYAERDALYPLPFSN
jgi:hypothetical protein